MGNPGVGNHIRERIIKALDEQGGEVHGVFELGHRIIGCQNIHWMRLQMNLLEDQQEIIIEDRGNCRAKIIKRNLRKATS